MGVRSSAATRGKDRNRSHATEVPHEMSAGDAMRILITNALAALAEPNDEAYEERLELLVDAYDSPGRAVFESALTEQVYGEIRAAWERGWQPADIVRALNRRDVATPVALAVDWMAAELRRYAPAKVDDRFSAQLDALREEIGPADAGQTDPTVAGWTARLGTDPAQVIAHLLELADTLGLLPTLPLLCPPPGRARLGRRCAPGAEATDPKVLERVRGLLAKAEASQFEAEAITFTAKAQEMIIRHSIDRARLDAGPDGTPHPGRGQQPGGIRIGVNQPYEAGRAGLLQKVAEANGCQSVWSQKLGFITVLGFPTDVAAVDLLYTSLLVQATRAMAEETPRKAHAATGSRTRSFRQAFLSAFAVRIGDRLRGVTDSGVRDGVANDSRLLPVLAGRERAVQALAHRLFPDVTYRPCQRNLDPEGWASGTRAADLARIGDPARPLRLIKGELDRVDLRFLESTLDQRRGNVWHRAAGDCGRPA